MDRSSRRHSNDVLIVKWSPAKIVFVEVQELIKPPVVRREALEIELNKHTRFGIFFLHKLASSRHIVLPFCLLLCISWLR
jgi:hypothetical protein